MSHVGAPAARSRAARIRAAEARRPAVPDIEEDFWRLHERCAEYTMTPVEAMYATYRAAQYVVRSACPATSWSVVCGEEATPCWRVSSWTSSGIAIARFSSTYALEGMVSPATRTSPCGGSGRARSSSNVVAGASDWCYSSLEEVQANMGTTGLDTGGSTS